jgi:RNase P/RNase MRP subunit p29
MAWGHRISPELAEQLIGSRADNTTVIYSSGPANNSVTHKIELDDGNENGIRLTTESGQKVTMSNGGTIELSHKDGASVTLDGQIITLSAGGSTLSIGPSGIEIKSADGSLLKIGSTIEGTAADTMSKFDQVTVSKHSHTGNVGYPTSPPTPGT